MTILGAFLAQLLHIALVLAAAPLIVGGLRWLKARITGRIGPHPLQPWRDLLKLLRKRPVLAEHASWISGAAPCLAAGAAAAALALVTSFARGMLFAPLGDLLLIGGLLLLGRIALVLAGLDAGTAFGGLGAARELSFAALAEPAMLLVALVLAMLAGTTGLDAVAATVQEGSPGMRVSLVLAALALTAVALADGARDSATHPELTTTREAMTLEASGRHLALWEAAAALRLTAWLALIAALFLPFGTAPAGFAPLGWVVGSLAWIAKITALCLLLAAFESTFAGMRAVRAPQLLGVATLLGLLGAILLFISARLA